VSDPDQRPFQHSAAYYDAIYTSMGKDYAGEAARIIERIDSLHPGATTLLDVACGPGRHLEAFAERYHCAGLDIDHELLAVARSRCPDVQLHQGDMVSFDLGRRFGAVTCLFSSIGYTRTEARLGQAIACMAQHLEPGGVLIVEPWFTPEAWSPPRVMTAVVEHDGTSVVRMTLSKAGATPDLSELDMQYLIGTAEGIEHRVEVHVLGLFTWDQYRAAFEAAGLATDVDEIGPIDRGLVIGRRPA
jgi:SAM-dependent methyltransferase